MAIKLRITAEELWELPERGDGHYELVEGEVIEVPGSGALHSAIADLIYDLLRAFAKKHGLGLVMSDGSTYILDRNPDLVRVPDVSFISRGRVDEVGFPEKYWPFAPDLAVEVVSPHDRADEIHDKIHQYLTAGTRVVWVAWPKRRSITVHTPDETRELGPDDTIDGGDLLPGFRAVVADLFDLRRAMDD